MLHLKETKKADNDNRQRRSFTSGDGQRTARGIDLNREIEVGERGQKAIGPLPKRFGKNRGDRRRKNTKNFCAESYESNSS